MGLIMRIARYLTLVGTELEKNYPTVQQVLTKEVTDLYGYLKQMESLCKENSMAMPALVLINLQYNSSNNRYTTEFRV